jgi:hypothetical protein
MSKFRNSNPENSDLVAQSQQCLEHENAVGFDFNCHAPEVLA